MELLHTEARLPTRHGTFALHGFEQPGVVGCTTAISKGTLEESEGVPLRLHSQCFTGDVLGSLRCDCRDQLHSAMRLIEEHGTGLIIYMMQEGRGIGLFNKIKAYALQDSFEVDTYAADEMLGFPRDSRNYSIAAAILGFLRVRSVKVMTNNPDKLMQLQHEGILVDGRIPLLSKECSENRRYLNSLRDRRSHLLPPSEQSLVVREPT